MMKGYFFDLDGTLTDSSQGLFTSFRAALDMLGVPGLTDRDLSRFLGTPLPEMFRALRPGIELAAIEDGIRAFRVAYEHDGIHQNRLYDGIEELLEKIAACGQQSWVVTSKPKPYADQVVEALGIASYIKGVVGAGLDEKDTKAELIATALDLASLGRTEVVMVGDRHYDVAGARANRVHPIGVLWGYGSRDELRAAGCDDLVRTPAEIFRRSVRHRLSEPAATRYAVAR